MMKARCAANPRQALTSHSNPYRSKDITPGHPVCDFTQFHHERVAGLLKQVVVHVRSPADAARHRTVLMRGAPRSDSRTGELTGRRTPLTECDTTSTAPAFESPWSPGTTISPSRIDLWTRSTLGLGSELKKTFAEALLRRRPGPGRRWGQRRRRW